MKQHNKILRLVFCALFTAITCVATMVIRIPSFASVGYVNIGDTAVLLSAWLIGGPYGAFAAGVGSAMADLLGGYSYYVPGTFAIKFLMAFAAWIIFDKMKKGGKNPFSAYVFSAVPAEIIMVAGYFLYKAFILGRFESAVLSILSNIVQGGTCIIIALALVAVFEKSGVLKRLPA